MTHSLFELSPLTIPALAEEPYRFGGRRILRDGLYLFIFDKWADGKRKQRKPIQASNEHSSFLMSNTDLCLFPLHASFLLHVSKSTPFPCCGMVALVLAFKVLQEMLFAELKGSCLLGLISVFSQYPLSH